MLGQFEILQANESDSESIKALLIKNGQRPTIIINSSSIYFLAKTEEKIIGAIGAEIEGPSALIRSTAVLQPWRNKGLAADLVKTIFEKLKSEKITNVYLFSRDSGRYWQKFGFDQCKVKEVLDHLPNAPQVVGYVNDGSIWSDITWHLRLT